MLHISYLQGPCKIRVKSSAGDQLALDAGGVDTRGSYHAREPKRQKKLIYGPSGAVLQSHTYSQKIVSHSDPAVSKLEDCKSMQVAPIISSAAPRDASYVDGNICALCHSSKITEVIFLQNYVFIFLDMKLLYALYS